MLLLILLTAKLRLLHETSLTNLVGADPLSFDRPHTTALVVWVIASKVAVLDQATSGMIAKEVDDFELRKSLMSIHVACKSWISYLTHAWILLFTIAVRQLSRCSSFCTC